MKAKVPHTEADNLVNPFIIKDKTVEPAATKHKHDEKTLVQKTITDFLVPGTRPHQPKTPTPSGSQVTGMHKTQRDSPSRPKI